jgi:hypothetical protein
MSLWDFIRIKGLEVLKYGEFIGTFCELFTIVLVLFTCHRVYENLWLLRVLTPEMDEIFAEHKDLSYRKPHGVRTCNLISCAPCRCYFVVSKPVISGVALQLIASLRRDITNYRSPLNVFVWNKVLKLSTCYYLLIKLFLREVYTCVPVILCGVLVQNSLPMPSNARCAVGCCDNDRCYPDLWVKRSHVDSLFPQTAKRRKGC